MRPLQNALPLLFILVSCATEVSCPSSKDTKVIAIVDHGRHTSLILPSKGNKAVRYVYGDWKYYALREMGLVTGARALLWPTKGALGRMWFSGPITKKNLALQLRVGIEKSFILSAPHSKIESLSTKLDQIFANRSIESIYNSSYDLNFVPLERSYWAFNNSNQKVGSWLEELGCEVKGLAIISNWKSERQSDPLPSR